MINKFIQKIPRRYRISLKKILGYTGYSDLNFKVNIEQTKDPKHFHFATLIGSHRVSNLIEPSLAKFLISRGHKVSVTLCDGALTGCLACSIWNQPKDKRSDNHFIKPQELGLCGGCYSPSLKTWQSTGAEIYTLSESNLDLETINKFKEKKLVVQGIDLSEDVVSGCLRFLCKGDSNSISEDLWKEYSSSAIKTASFYIKLLKEINIDLCFYVHGIYVPHGVLNKVLLAKGVDFYNYNTSYREKRFYFTKNNTYHYVFPNETDQDLKLKDTTEEEIVHSANYLASRSKVT